MWLAQRRISRASKRRWQAMNQRCPDVSADLVAEVNIISRSQMSSSTATILWYRHSVIELDW